jgi:hypothetical protein
MYRVIARSKTQQHVTRLGRAHSSLLAEDLAQWLKNLDSGRLGGRAVLERIRQPGKLNDGERLHYAFGLFAGEYKGEKFIEHGGECPAYRSATSYFPGRRFGLAVLANLKTVDVWGIARQISDPFLFDRPTPNNTTSGGMERRAITVDPAVYEAYTGRYLIEPGRSPRLKETIERDRCPGANRPCPRVSIRKHYDSF